MNIFKTKYRVEVTGSYYAVYKTKWYWLGSEYVGMYDSLETAKERIQMEKSNPVWEE